jgi:hypothetical protein
VVGKAEKGNKLEQRAGMIETKKEKKKKEEES